MYYLKTLLLFLLVLVFPSRLGAHLFALEDSKAFHLDVTTNPDNTVQETAIVNTYFLDLFSEIQVEIEDKMKNIKLTHIINHILEKKGS